MSVDTVLFPSFELRRGVEIALGIVFAYSSAPKVYRPTVFLRAVADYELLPRHLVAPLGVGVITTEVLLAAALLSGTAVAVAAPIAALLLSVFGAAIAINLWRGRMNPCGCFGESDGSISKRSLVRLAFLLAGAGVACLPLRSAAPGGEIVSMSLLKDVTIAFLLLTTGLWALSLPELIRLGRLAGRSVSPDRGQHTGV